MSLGATHVSVYDLIVERGTLFSRWFPDSDSDAPAQHGPAAQASRPVPRCVPSRAAGRSGPDFRREARRPCRLAGAVTVDRGSGRRNGGAGQVGGLPSEEASAAMYRRTHAVLEAAGYVHYEVPRRDGPGV